MTGSLPRPVVAGARKLRIGIVGMGAIGRSLVQCLTANDGWREAHVVGVLVRQIPLQAQIPDAIAGQANVTTDLGHFLEANPDLVIECAGHAAVRQLCPEILMYGIDVLMISSGALADADVEGALRHAVERSTATLTIPSGAVGGLDLLAGARLAGLTEVRYASRKTPAAWKGTAAEHLLDLDALDEPKEFFSGTARAAALAYPQNANVAASVALAGLGFDRTHVTLTADPAATGNEHRIVAHGAFGGADVRIAGNPLPDNPKTSWLASLSLARSVLNRSGRIVI